MGLAPIIQLFLLVVIYEDSCWAGATSVLKGQCLCYTCVKNGQHCTSCLPSKLGKWVNVLSEKKAGDVCSQSSPCASSHVIITAIISSSQSLPDPTMTQLLSDVPTSCSPSTSDFNLNYIPNSTTPTHPLPSPSLSLHPQTVIDSPLFHPVSDPHFK